MNRLIFRSLLALSVAPLSAFARQDDAKTAQPQSAVASKTATFATVAATDAAVKKATDATKLDALKKLLDTDGAIVGTVSAIYAPQGSKLAILNFAEDHWKAATVVVRERDFAKFPVLRTLVGKKVLVTGRISEFKNKPQIEMTSLAQIKVVKEEAVKE